MSKLGSILKWLTRVLNRIPIEPILALSDFVSDTILVFNSCSIESCMSNKK